MLYIVTSSKKKKVVLLIYLMTVKQWNNNAHSCFEKKINKAAHCYLITFALRSRGDMLYVGLNTKNKTWENVLLEENLDLKVSNFHSTIVDICDKHFPTKIVKISNLDKKWITTELKTLSRKIKKEFYRHKKAPCGKSWKRNSKPRKNMLFRLFIKILWQIWNPQIQENSIWCVRKLGL